MAPYSAFPEEAEVLFPTNCQFRVLHQHSMQVKRLLQWAVRKDMSNVMVVEMEEVVLGTVGDLLAALTPAERLRGAFWIEALKNHAAYAPRQAARHEYAAEGRQAVESAFLSASKARGNAMVAELFMAFMPELSSLREAVTSSIEAGSSDVAMRFLAKGYSPHLCVSRDRAHRLKPLHVEVSAAAPETPIALPIVEFDAHAIPLKGQVVVIREQHDERVPQVPTLTQPSPNPHPTLTQPSPNPHPTLTQPSPNPHQPSPNPHPTLTQPSPNPHPTLTQPSPNPHQPSPTLTQPSPNPHQPSPNPHPTLTQPSPNPHPTLTQPSPNPHPTLTQPSPTLTNPHPTLTQP